jgi:hypothetical protein
MAGKLTDRTSSGKLIKAGSLNRNSDMAVLTLFCLGLAARSVTPEPAIRTTGQDVTYLYVTL